MLNKITSTIFNVAALLTGVAATAALVITGHMAYTGGFLLSMGAILGAILFGFRLAEGSGTDRLSIWVGPLRPMRPTPPSASGVAALDKAA